MSNISVIIPAYNAEKNLDNTLKSLENQTYKNFTVFIIDDGSIDRTSEIANQYVMKDSRFKYFYQENRGVSIARNKGIKKSRSDYISFLDADDYFKENFLEVMYKTIINKKATVCYCGYNVINNKSQHIKKTAFTNRNVLLKYILNVVNIHTTGWMIKRKYLIDNSIEFPEKISWGEDIEFFSEVLSNADKICYVKDYLTNYRIEHEEEQLSDFSLKKIDQDYYSIMRMINNEKINKSPKIEKALVDYRLQALIVYRLLLAINKKYSNEQVKLYYDKYYQNMEKITLNNGLRSIKLNFNKIKLYYVLNKMNK